MPANFWSDKSLFDLYEISDSAKLALFKEKWKAQEAQAQGAGRSSKTARIPTRALPFFGEHLGFLRKPEQPIVATVFVTKGGALKTSLTLNLARMAALHNIRTCVVGLDIQGDITSALGHQSDLESYGTLSEALKHLAELKGLSQLYEGKSTLESLLVPTDLASLWLIPETPELGALDQSLIQRHRREYWLKDKVLAPLKESFDLILIDGPPNWNRLITNALVGCDWLLVPLECKINNFRNLQMFKHLLAQAREELNLAFSDLYIPTRWSPQRRLSCEILEWYQESLSSCSPTAIRESALGEEATALHISLAEHAPSSSLGREMREIAKWIWSFWLNDSQRDFSNEKRGRVMWQSP